MKYTKEYWEWNNSQDDLLLRANPNYLENDYFEDVLEACKEIVKYTK